MKTWMMSLLFASLPLAALAQAPAPAAPQTASDHGFDGTPPVRFEAVVHSIAAHRAILGVKIEEAHVGDLVKLGYRKVDRAEDIDHRTLFDGRAWSERMAVDEEVFAKFKPGSKVRCEMRRTFEGRMLITSAR